ncbi:hypothetical protein, conserved [Trypanosoma brucei gambiense DAL972]|uniref:Cyclin N-terminal domain-containing protein n=1 Tax=Trypanosoma brucei gambiense (strain MHOM/CI/86/DAL972) TaxID=679716 RepID=D0A432_TRYB9|nr:hypothetical protein, conserved [Trypanosoma brucei gambiense DAL972]CBH16026.1 hypothetical protein, conserved [Trypanosoma brucei gambiense DAL972]|eukprot:XP_011778290.1 hypothetical protein, conserved [Trypanosoma brucei gambiense DAL972]
MTATSGFDWLCDARRAFCAYGVDLIRTGSILVRTTPSVTYRASVLFQRFQAAAEEVRQKRGDYHSEEGFQRGSISRSGIEETCVMGIGLATCRQATYTIPSHVGTECSPGVLVLGDLFAPLDYCLYHFEDHDDIVYLAAACILVAAKVEDPSTRIRSIVSVFMRLNQRRRNEPVIELLQPPPERYENFKTRVREAEEIVLQTLGFQTFVECPFKYAIIFLGILVGNDPVDGGLVVTVGASPPQPPAAAGAANPTTPLVGSRPLQGSEAFSCPSAKKWLADAVCWLNDIPRWRELYAEEAYVLAVCALYWTRPPDVSGLPEEWTAAFGVESSKRDSVLSVYRENLDGALGSEKHKIEVLLTARHEKPDYPTMGQPARVANEEDEAASGGKPLLPPSDVSAVGTDPMPIQVKPTEPNTPIFIPDIVVGTAISAGPIIPPPSPSVVTPPSLAVLQSALSIPITLPPQQPISSNTTGAGGISCSGPLGLEEVLPGGGEEYNKSLPLEAVAPGIAELRPAEEEYQFEDFKEMQRRRRQKEEAELRQTKRRRSSSRRRRHRSDEKRRRRSDSHDRRRSDSRERRRRPRAPSPHKNRSGDRQHQHQHHHRQHPAATSQRPKSDRRDDRHRNDDYKRNDGKSQRRRR